MNEWRISIDLMDWIEIFKNRFIKQILIHET